MSAAARRRRTSPRRKRRLHPIVISLLAIFAVVFVTFYAFNQGLPFVSTVHDVRAGQQQRQRPRGLAGADRGDRRRRRSGRLAGRPRITNRLHARPDGPADPHRRHDADPRPPVPRGRLLPARSTRAARTPRSLRRASRFRSPRPPARCSSTRCSRPSTRPAARASSGCSARSTRASARSRDSAGSASGAGGPEDCHPSAHPGAQGRRLGDARAARDPVGRRAEAAQLGLGRHLHAGRQLGPAD